VSRRGSSFDLAAERIGQARALLAETRDPAGIDERIASLGIDAGLPAATWRALLG
jgi:hypothetical protein